MISRRTFLSGAAAYAALITTVGAAPRRSKSAQNRESYEDLLAARFRAGRAVFPSMFLAQMAGFSARLPEWLDAACKECKLDPVDLTRQFQVVLTADPARIEKDMFPRARPDWLSGENQEGAEALDRGLARAAVTPLALLGRGDVLVALHANALDRLKAGTTSELTVRAVTALAESGDWTNALAILERARRTSTNVAIEPEKERVLWKYAYLHREAERVMPVLATMPFGTDTPARREDRTWMLKVYQIRAGDEGAQVPVLSDSKGPNYLMAVAMQVAALENDPASDGRIKDLKALLSSRPTQTITHNGVEFRINLATVALSQARAAIAARRKDSARATEHAKTRGRDGANPANHMTAAFLEEGDWQGAAATLRTHDPRRRKSVAGDGAVEYVQFHRSIAVAAAWSGDDTAAAEALAKAQAEYARLMEKHPGEFDGDDLGWHPAILAGVAEGKLPRKRIHVLVDAFPS